MSSLVISADSLGEFFDALSLSRQGNGIFIYSAQEEMGDEPGKVTTLKGLASNDDMTFFGSYRVEAEMCDIKQFYLSPTTVGQIDSFVALIAENLQSEEESEAEEESDEDFYVAVKIEFENQDNGDTMIRISPSTGDPDNDAKFGGFLTQEAEENLSDTFPARQISDVIAGKGLDEPPFYVDKTDVDENPIGVPNGPVSVWDCGTKDPMPMAMAKARSFKLPLAVERHHASRIHCIRIGENWFGAIAPVPLNSSDMSDQGIYADTTSLNAEYDFSGLREEDAEELEQPTQFHEPEEEPEALEEPEEMDESLNDEESEEIFFSEDEE